MAKIKIINGQYIADGRITKKSRDKTYCHLHSLDEEYAMIQKLGKIEDWEESRNIDVLKLRSRSKYLIIDVENFIKNCKQFVYRTTDNELVVSINAKLRMDDKIENDLEDYLKECVVKTLLREIENCSIRKD